jgi:hypothetical protein
MVVAGICLSQPRPAGQKKSSGWISHKMVRFVDLLARGVTLTIFAALLVLVAISDFLKPFHLFPNDGFVFLGTKLTGAANAVMGPLFGIVVMVGAYGIWAIRKFALPIAYVFVLCVILNMVLYTIKSGAARPLPIANVAVGIGVPLALAIILHRRRADLS